ncbi:hypothetical protein KOR42_01360 [Thalassoglobus neptunius]|uniref:Uncharacterized protein n=2 Tax=Thalassoglobus neptunius TaxID=1938619 RepID=A0A5C5X3B4_9PLAN|nr:hypothetical protein KOR42_01360 [Thalassoglobus neptunius]
MQIKRFRFVWLLGVSALFVGFEQTAMGQGGFGGPGGGYGYGGDPRPEPVKGDVSFKGGTLEEFAATMRESFQDLNLIVDEKARSAKVNELHVRNVSAKSILDLLRVLTTPPVEVSISQPDMIAFLRTAPTTSGMGVDYGVDYGGGGGYGGGGYGMGGMMGGDYGGVSQKLTMIIETFPVGPMLSDDSTLEVDDLLSTIETAIELREDTAESTPIRLKYHPKTGLMIVAGTETDLEVVRQIIDALKLVSQHEAKATEMDDERKALMENVKNYASELHQTKQKIAELEELVKKRESEILSLQKQVIEAKRDSR